MRIWDYRFINIFILFTSFIIFPVFSFSQSKPEGKEWRSLFNGKDLTGWITPRAEHSWKVIDGVIDYEAKGGNLITEESFGDYILYIEWRFKRTAGLPYKVKLFNPDGTIKRGADGKPIKKSIANADSGIYVRGNPETQVNIWCWPCGSGQLWSYHNHKDPKIRAGALPKVNADKPVGEWNAMQITVKGDRITIILNDKTVIDNSQMPGAPKTGPIALQHHGGFNSETKTWKSASSLIQFRNIWIKTLD